MCRKATVLVRLSGWALPALMVGVSVAAPLAPVQIPVLTAAQRRERRLEHSPAVKVLNPYYIRIATAIVTHDENALAQYAAAMGKFAADRSRPYLRFAATRAEVFCLARAGWLLSRLGWSGQIRVEREPSVVLSIFAGLPRYGFPIGRGILTGAHGAQAAFQRSYMYAFRARPMQVHKRCSARVNGHLFNMAARILCYPIAARIKSELVVEHGLKMPTAITRTDLVWIPKKGIDHSVRVPLPKAPHYHAPKSRG